MAAYAIGEPESLAYVRPQCLIPPCVTRLDYSWTRQPGVSLIPPLSVCPKRSRNRQAFISRPRKKMSEKQRGRLEELLQQEVPAHEGEPFIAEPDLRALPAFKKGEVNE